MSHTSRPPSPIEVTLESRPKLQERLAAAVDSRLAVVVGPIGSGVTTTLQQWCRRERGRRDLRILTADDSLPEAINAARRSGGAVTVVVDDASARPVTELRAVVEDHDADPGSVTLVLGGSPDTINPIGWALTNRADRIVGTEELWFDREEIARCAGLELGASETDAIVDGLDEFTLGWPAAVMAVLEASWSIDDLHIDRNGFGLPVCPTPLVERFGGRMAREGMTDLLLLLGRVAPFAWVDEERLAAVVDDRSAFSIEALRNLGIPTTSRRDGAPPGSWRPHPLLRSAGHRHLCEHDADGARDALRRAAERLVDEREFALALGCFRELGDGPALVRFIVGHLYDIVDAGIADSVLEILDDVPLTEVLEVPFGLFNYGFLFRLVGDEARAQQILNGLDSPRVDGGRPRYDGPTARAVVTAAGIGYGRHPEVVRKAAASILGRPEEEHPDPVAPSPYRKGGSPLRRGFAAEDAWTAPWQLMPTAVHAFVCASAAEAEMRLGDLDAVRRWLVLGRRDAGLDARNVAVLDALEAAIDAECGALDRAEMLARSAARGLDLLAPYVSTIDPRITLARVIIDRGDQGADEILTAPEAAARRIRAFNRIAVIELLHVRMALAMSRYRRGLRILDESAVLGSHRIALDLRRRADALRALLMLRLGDLVGAERAAAGAEDPAVRAALAIASGNHRKLRLVVDTWPASDRIADRARWLAVSAELASLVGTRDVLVQSLTELARLVSRSGYLQPILDLGIDLGGLVRTALEEADDLRLVHLARHLENRTGSGQRVSLSSRELEVLEGIAGFIPDDELAELLGIRASTVKSHHRAIFRKLKVRSRGEAVRRAEDLGLLAPRPSRLPIR